MAFLKSRSVSFCAIVSVLGALASAQSVDTSKLPLKRGDITVQAACNKVRQLLAFQPLIQFPKDNVWKVETKLVSNGKVKVRTYFMWANPDRLKPIGFYANVDLCTGKILAFDNMARNDLRYRTDRSTLPLKYGTEKQANQLLTTVATKLGVMKPGLRLEFKHKLSNKRKPSVAAVVRDSTKNLVATIECDPVDGTILHFWRSIKA